MADVITAIAQFLIHGGGGAFTLVIVAGVIGLFTFKGLPFILECLKMSKEYGLKQDEKTTKLLESIELTNKALTKHIEDDAAFKTQIVAELENISRINDEQGADLKDLKLDKLKTMIKHNGLEESERMAAGIRYLKAGGNHETKQWIIENWYNNPTFITLAKIMDYELI